METFQLLITGIIQLILVITIFVMAYRLKKIKQNQEKTQTLDFTKAIFLYGPGEKARTILMEDIYDFILMHAQKGRTAEQIQEKISYAFKESFQLLDENVPDLKEIISKLFYDTISKPH